MSRPIIQLSIETVLDFHHQRTINRLASYVGEYYEQFIPKGDYGLIKKILIIVSESDENWVWPASKADPILTLYYKADLKAVIDHQKNKYEIVKVLNNLLIQSLQYYSSHLPIEVKVFEDVSDEFCRSGFNYSIQLEKKKSPDRKGYGMVRVEISPEKAVFYGVRLNNENVVLNKVKLQETTPAVYAFSGIVHKAKWVTRESFVVLSRICVQYHIDFEKSICVVEFEQNEKKKQYSEIQLKLLSPDITLEEILELQVVQKSLLFRE